MTLPVLSLWGESKQELLEDTLGRYTRDVTVLEIGEFPRESIYQLAGRYPGSVFIIMGKDQAGFVEEIREKDFSKNVIWLNLFQLSKIFKCFLYANILISLF